MNDKKKQIEKLENIINDYLENIITVDEQTLAKRYMTNYSPKIALCLLKKKPIDLDGKLSILKKLKHKHARKQQKNF